MKLKNIFTFSVNNLFRSSFLTVATVAIIALILFTFNVILSLHIIAKAGLNDVQEKVDIVFYLKDSPDPIRVSQFIEEVESISTVKEVIYTSKEDALLNLLSKYPVSTDPFTKYGITNPLPPNINVITSDASKHNEIFDLADSNRYLTLFENLSENTENEQIITKLLSLTKSSTRILISTLIIFIIASIMIVSNAITLSIYHKREELNIMKVVGAPPMALRGPFIFEGVLYGLSGFIISMILLFAFLRITEINLISFNLNVELTQFALLELVSCLLIGAISSMIAIERYLRVKK